MCLGIPAQITAIVDPGSGRAEATTNGVSREVNIAMLALKNEDIQTLIGKWVLVHVGFAMALIDEQEANQTLALLVEAGELEHG